MEEVSEVRAEFVLFEKVGNDELCAPALPIYTNRNAIQPSMSKSLL